MLWVEVGSGGVQWGEELKERRREAIFLEHKVVNIMLDLLQKMMLRHKIVNIMLDLLHKTERLSFVFRPNRANMLE